MSLPTVPKLELIAQRLPLIFPEGTEHRNYCIREMAAKTIFVMFYIGAIEGLERWLRPSQVTDMSDKQAEIIDDISRLEWTNISLSNNKKRPGDAWYAPNSREPIRDETIRLGLKPCRAIIERQGLPTTSSKPKYALDADFAQLFKHDLVSEALENAIINWQISHLSKAAMTRLQLMKHGASVAKDAVVVTFPNGEKRYLAAGPSSVISKAVIEVFANNFLKEPAVLWLSESGNKVVARDEGLATTLGLNIDPSKALPDIILIDLGSAVDGSEMLVVFIEVVATDGPINRERKTTLRKLAIEAGFDEDQLAFLTAYLDRSGASFRRNISDLAWGSYVWCAAEPDYIIKLSDGTPLQL